MLKKYKRAHPTLLVMVLLLRAYHILYQVTLRGVRIFLKVKVERWQELAVRVANRPVVLQQTLSFTQSRFDPHQPSNTASSISVVIVHHIQLNHYSLQISVC